MTVNNYGSYKFNQYKTDCLVEGLFTLNWLFVSLKDFDLFADLYTNLDLSITIFSADAFFDLS